MRSHAFLFEQLVKRELRQRYKGTVLGVLWYVINPLVLMAAYAVMFGKFLPLPRIPDYPLFLIIGIVVWTFFSQSLTAAAPSLIEQSSLVAKARFPRAIVPGAVVTVQAVTFVILLGLVTPIVLVVRDSLGPSLLLLPLAVAALAAFVLGLSLIVAVTHAYYRDVAPIVSAALLPWFFMTPIFFRPDTLDYFARHDWAQALIEWGNPVAPFIEAVRAPLYDGAAPGAGVLVYVVVAAGLSLLAGRAVFGRMQRELAVVL